MRVAIPELVSRLVAQRFTAIASGIAAPRYGASKPVLLVLCVSICAAPADVHGAQQRRTPAPPKAKAAPPPAAKTEPAQIKCSEVLGTGVKTNASFCFVLAGREPAQGVIVTIPPHVGAATLTFSLHNRHTYSEEEMRAGRGFSKYMAVVAVLTMAGEVLGRGAVQSEFRSAKDLYDRVSGGAGPGGAKAVAPIGNESVVLTIPADVQEVSLLGEVLESTTAAGREVAAPGRPVAIVSGVQVEYRPAPPGRKR
jgi:hypothetical protein